MLEPYGAEGHVVCVERWGWWIGREELDVECVGSVDWNHSLAVVVQVFEQNLAQRVYLARVWFRSILREKLALFLQGSEEGVQFPHDGDISAEIGIFGQHEAEVKGVGISWVGGRGDVLRVAEDAVMGGSELEKARVAEGGVRDDEAGDCGKMKERYGVDGRGCGDGGGGDLVENFGTYGDLLAGCSGEGSGHGMAEWGRYLR